MEIKIYQIDAFTSNIFGGNPAAICPLEVWISDQQMQNIALENNLSETAFFVKQENGNFKIRYFTPEVEIDLCGHATLAAAHLIFNILELAKEEIIFEANKDVLPIRNNEGRIVMNFPANVAMNKEIESSYKTVIGKHPLAAYSKDDVLLLEFENQKDIANINPNFSLFDQIKESIVVATSIGQDCDFVSRVFGPKVGINEDPVTGYAHTFLIPHWANKLERKTMFAKQISKRGGELFVEHLGDRVIISGNACLFMKGEIFI